MNHFGKFLNLSSEKQKIIINAALESFSTNGYKKTSVSDIATKASISKALVFHYFSTKKALYLYLITFCTHTIMDEINEKFDNTVTDFFDRIKLSADIEISVIKRQPAMLSFLNSIYFENDDAVKADIETILLSSDSEKLRNKIAFDGTDTSKFKDDIDPKLVMNILIKLADGYFSKTQIKTTAEFDALCKEFDACLNLFKKKFYKEKYL